MRLWDTRTWKQVDRPLTHETYVYALAFTPDDTRLAAACADGVIRLWDVARRQDVAELRGHIDYVYALSFSPDGSRLASGSGDFTVRIWDTLNPAERAGMDRRPTKTLKDAISWFVEMGTNGSPNGISH